MSRQEDRRMAHLSTIYFLQMLLVCGLFLFVLDWHLSNDEGAQSLWDMYRNPLRYYSIAAGNPEIPAARGDLKDRLKGK